MFEIGLDDKGNPYIAATKDPKLNADQYAVILWMLGKKYYQTAMFEMISTKLPTEQLAQVCQRFMDLEQVDFIPAVSPLEGTQ